MLLSAVFDSFSVNVVEAQNGSHTLKNETPQVWLLYRSFGRAVGRRTSNFWLFLCKCGRSSKWFPRDF